MTKNKASALTIGILKVLTPGIAHSYKNILSISKNYTDVCVNDSKKCYNT
jgi:hypothetical protein